MHTCVLGGLHRQLRHPL